MPPVVVHLRAPNAISIHVDEMRDAGEGGHGAFSMNTPGTKTAMRGPSIELRPGRNEVDPEVWKAWAEQNKDGGLLASGLIYVEDQQKTES